MTLAQVSVVVSAGCSPARAPGDSDEASRYLFVWAGDPDPGDSDFLAVIDVDSTSASYRQVLATVPVGFSSGAHHTEHVMHEGGRIFVNGFRSGRSWVINVSDPLAPFVEAAFESRGPYTYPHSFERTPSGTVIATFQNRGEGNRQPGGLVELDSLGGLIRASDAADPTDPELRPYSLAISPELTASRAPPQTCDRSTWDGPFRCGASPVSSCFTPCFCLWAPEGMSIFIRRSRAFSPTAGP